MLLRWAREACVERRRECSLADADAWSRLHAPALVGARTRNHVAVRASLPKLPRPAVPYFNHEAGAGQAESPRVIKPVYVNGQPLHRCICIPPIAPSLASHNPRSPFVRVAFLAGATHTEHSSASPQLAVSTHRAGILEVGRSAHTNPRRHRSHLRI